MIWKWMKCVPDYVLARARVWLCCGLLAMKMNMKLELYEIGFHQPISKNP